MTRDAAAVRKKAGKFAELRGDRLADVGAVVAMPAGVAPVVTRRSRAAPHRNHHQTDCR